MQLYSVQLIPGKAEITGDKGIYPKAAPTPPPNFKSLILHTIHVLINILFYTMDFGISAEIQSCGFILPWRKNMETHSFTVNFF